MRLSKETADLIARALAEDIGKGDLTSRFTLNARTKIRCQIIAKEKGILCGIDIAREVFARISPKILFKASCKDRAKLKKNEVVATVSGNAVDILKGERVAINFLSRLSGVATYTNEFVKKVQGTGVRIMDTRKTTPGLRTLEKYAVSVGGGFNHRKGLWECILIKDNHLRASHIFYRGRIDAKKLKDIIALIRKRSSAIVEVEVEGLREFKKVIECKPDWIMLDNFGQRSIRKAVAFRNRSYPRIKLEASGGICLKNVRTIAQTKVDYISIGRITHSPQSIDFSLEVA